MAMRQVLRVVPATVLFVLGSTRLQAQVCLGVGTPAASSRLMSTTASGTDLGRAASARYGLTGERLFGGVSLGADGREFARLDAPTVGADIGRIIPLSRSGATQLCPLLQTTYIGGPRTSGSVQHQLLSSFGLSLGHSLQITRSVAMIPFAQGGVQYAWYNNTLSGEAAIGLGFTFNDRLTLTPRYNQTLGQQNRPGMYQQRYSLGITFAIPR